MQNTAPFDLEVEALEAVRELTARMVGEDPNLTHCHLFYECRRPIYTHWYDYMDNPQLKERMNCTVLQMLSYAHLAMGDVLNAFGTDGFYGVRAHLCDDMAKEFCPNAVDVKTEYTLSLPLANA